MDVEEVLAERGLNITGTSKEASTDSNRRLQGKDPHQIIPRLEGVSARSNRSWNIQPEHLHKLKSVIIGFTIVETDVLWASLVIGRSDIH